MSADASHVRFRLSPKEAEGVTMSPFQGGFSSTRGQNTTTKAENTLVVDPVLNQPSCSGGKVTMVHVKTKRVMKILTMLPFQL